MATLLRADGTREALDAGRDGLSLQQMQAAVGGYIEIVYVGSPTDTATRRTVLVVDEEGLLKSKPPNVAATVLYRGTPARHAGVIVGDVLLATMVDPGLDGERII